MNRAGLRVRPAAGQTASISTTSLPTIIQWFKSISTHDYAHGVQHHGLLPFRNRLWQRNYYDRIIRNDAELDRTRAYVDANPASWRQDDEHPETSRFLWHPCATNHPFASAITTPSPYSPRYEEHHDHVRTRPDG